MTENLDPNKMYLEWSGSSFPNSSSATFKAPAGSTIDWGDGTVETFDTDSPQVNTHTYTDELTEHTIAISGLTNIGNEAFWQCSSLTSLEIPDSVTSIGEKAFRACNGLQSVVIGNGVTSIDREAFFVCNRLMSVVIGDSVTSIGESAFNGCARLVEVVNKSPYITVKKGDSHANGLVGYYALAVYNSGDTFESKLSNDNGYSIYTDGEEKILVGYTGTETNLVLPSYVTKINRYALYGINSLTSVVIPDGVTSIGESAFQNSHNLTSVVIPNSVTSIDREAFMGCDSLTSVLIPDSVTSISEYMFYNCSSLPSLVIPNSVTSIGGYAFFGCSSLTFHEYGNCQYLGNEENPYYALIQPKNKDNSAYTIHENTKIIADRAFEYCRSLTSVVIGDSVTSIGQMVFMGCDSLTSVIAFPATPPKLAFSSIPSTIQSIYVQKSSAEAYKSAAYWNPFADKIVGNTTYLSFVRFNQANKKYIDSKISALESRIAELESKLNG